jgi:predicted dehydrogenase
MKAEALSKKYNIQHVCCSVEELISKAHPDLIVVAVTETSLEQIINYLTKYPCVALLEKPVGLNPTQSQKIYKKVKDSCLNCIVGLNRRFYSSTKQVIEHLKTSDGSRFIQVNDCESLYVAKSFNYSSEIVNHWMYANSIHLLDYFLFLGRGAITNVQVIQKWDPDKLLPVIAQIFFESGDQGIYTAVWHGPGPWSVSVTTNEDYFELKPLEQASRRTNKDRNIDIFQSDPVDVNFKPGLYEQAKNAVQFALDQPSQSVTLYESLKTMELIRNIYRV